MSKVLFEDGIAYPTDEVGEYIELEGKVVALEVEFGIVDVLVKMDGSTTRILTGIWPISSGRHAPDYGCIATIRVYRSGGGRYPDNKITSWRKE